MDAFWLVWQLHLAELFSCVICGVFSCRRPKLAAPVNSRSRLTRCNIHYGVVPRSFKWFKRQRAAALCTWPGPRYITNLSLVIHYVIHIFHMLSTL